MSGAENKLLSRAAALAILAVLLAALWFGPVASYIALRAGDARAIAAAEAILARDQALVAAGRAAPENGGAVLLPAISDAEAAALLQESLKRAAEASDVEIEGMQVIEGDTLAGAPRVALRLRAEGDVGALARLLYAISASRPLLYPDNLHIAAHGTTGALDFEFDVSAFKAATPS
jgi:hypothetical protein